MNFDALGITSYYDRLVYGEKDRFVVLVADAIGLSTQAVRRKIKLGKWNEKTELPLVNNVIATFA